MKARTDTSMQIKMRTKAWQELLRYWLGSFNGIQIFVFPVVLLNWFHGLRMVEVVSDLLGIKIHYFPLSIFLFLAAYVVLIIAKYLVSHLEYGGRTRAEFKLFIINLHKVLLIALLAFALLFLLAFFLKYFYGILISEKAIASWAARALGIIMILFCHLSTTWEEPWLRLGHSSQNAQARVRVFARQKTYSFIGFNLLQLIIIFLFCRVFINWQEYVYAPILYSLGINIRISLIPLKNTLALSINVILVSFAALCSSFFFIPLVWLATQITRFLHPIKPKTKI